MSLQFGGSSASDGSGIYIGKGKVVAMKDISGKLPFEKADTPCDIGMVFLLEVGQSFQPEFSVHGKFKKENDVVKGWGGATCVKMTLDNFGIEGGLTESNTFPDGLLQSFIGKEVRTLSYIRGEKDGKIQWGRWNVLAPAGKEDQLKKQFELSVKKGYPKDFKSGDKPKSDEFGAPAASTPPVQDTPF
jgi:hypothetical protein